MPKVRIDGQQTVRYSQVKDVTQQQYEELLEAYENGDDEFIAEWIDTHDLIDAVDFECDDMRLLNEDANAD